MSPARVAAKHPVDIHETVVAARRDGPVTGEQYTVVTYEADGEATVRSMYRAVRWFDSRGLEWLDDPTPEARETLQAHLDDE